MTPVDVRTEGRTATRLPLHSLQVEQFRAFKDLRISKLGRVNLIVGKNNVGKTCLLEAIQLYANNGWPDVIWTILAGRDEVKRSLDPVAASYRSDPRETDDSMAIRSLFYGRPEVLVFGQPAGPITIGPIADQSKLLRIGIGWFVTERVTPTVDLREVTDDDESVEIDSLTPRFTITVGNKVDHRYRIDSSRIGNRRNRFEDDTIACQFIRASGMSNSQVGALYDSVLRRGQDEDIVDALRIIAPDVVRLNFVGERERTPIVSIKGVETPVPLRSLGDGMNRLLGIAAALASVSDGLLLIDEIDTGLHYSVQREMWDLVFRVARSLNVQVFATTHSWDCIQAFQEAAQDDAAEGMLVRLQERGGVHVTTSFDEQELHVVTRRQLEVR